MTLNSAHNFTVKETATVTWPVTEFSTQNGKVSSQIFSTPSIKCNFILRMDLIGKLFDANYDDYVYIYLCIFEKWNELKFDPVRFRISILDSDEKKHFTREYTSHFAFDNRTVVGYIKREKCTPFLVNNTLTIHCEVDVMSNANQGKRKAPEDELEDSSTKTCGDYRTLLESGKLSDFVIVVGEKKLQVHKAILSARSPVFAAMFDHKDIKEVVEGKMEISDIKDDVFEELIRYIYCGQIESLDEKASDLFVAADLYQLDHMKSICEQSLIESLSSESVCSVVLLADMHNAVQLKSKSIQFMIDNCDKVMATEGWKELMDTKRMDLLAELFKISASQFKS